MQPQSLSDQNDRMVPIDTSGERPLKIELEE